ncbi:MAG: Dabb family protein [Candidatus Zixiibacteriota bacterium]
MLRHVILFKFRTSASQQQRQEALNRLTGLGSKLPQVREWSVGLQASHRDKAYDMALVSSFDSLDALKEFRSEPEHGKVREHLLKVADWIVVDFEFKK